MSHVFPLVSGLVMNRAFVQTLLAAEDPSGALGMIEENRQAFGLIALSPHEIIPAAVSSRGFELGHCVLGGDSFEVVQLTFEFRGFATYHLLLNPNSPVVRSVLGHVLDSGNYFILVLGADGDVQVFGSDVGEDSLIWLQAFLPRLLASRTTTEQYRRAVAAFARNPQPPGQVLQWICGDDAKHLDLCGDRVELSPMGAAVRGR